MNSRAEGAFEVKLSSEPLSAAAGETGTMRMSLEKVFQGDLVGTSQGEMLAFRSAVQGSAGYTAIEVVTGTLAGRSGSFVLQHSSTMTRGAPAPSVIVVPDSGTGALKGITGAMEIIIADEAHSYVFDYELPDLTST